MTRKGRNIWCNPLVSTVTKNYVVPPQVESGQSCEWLERDHLATVTCNGDSFDLYWGGLCHLRPSGCVHAIEGETPVMSQEAY